MIVFCLGTMSSGSTWVFNVARMIAARDQRKSVSFFCENVEEFVRNFEPVDGFNIVKCHHLDERLVDLACLTKAKLIFSSRDPRDCAVSLFERFSYGADQVISSLSGSYATRFSLPREIETLNFRYDENLRFSAANVKQIAKFIGVEIDEKFASATAAEFSHVNISEKIQGLTAYEPDTHWHPGHVSDGLSGKFLERLDPALRRVVEEAIIPFDQAKGLAEMAVFWAPDLFACDPEADRGPPCIVKCNGEERPLLWGPAFHLPRGRWKFDLIVRPLDENLRLRVDIVAKNLQERVLFTSIFSIDEGNRFTLHVDNFHFSDQISLRVSSIDDGRFGFFEFLGVIVEFDGKLRRLPGGIARPISPRPDNRAADVADAANRAGVGAPLRKARAARKPPTRKMAVAQPAVAPHRLAYYPPLIAGGKWSWSARAIYANACISGDFYAVEGDGAWSAGANGRIAVPVGGTPGEMVRISGEIVFSFFRGIIASTPAAMLYVNGEASAAVLHLAGDEPFHRARFAAIVPAGEQAQLRLECSHAASPAECGLGDDRRMMALILHAIELSAQSALPDGACEHLQIWGVGERPLDISRTEERQDDGEPAR